MRSRTTKGEAGLRFARFHARRAGDEATARLITEILRDDDMAAVAAARLEEGADGGRPVQDFLQWIMDHWDELREIIEYIIGLFGGTPPSADG